MLVNFADKAVLGLAGPEIMKEFGLSRQEFGTAQAAFFSLFSLSALGVSFLTRKVRTSVLLLVMGLLWSATQLPMLWGAAGFGTLIVTRVLLGIAEGPRRPWRSTMCTAGSSSGNAPCPRQSSWWAPRRGSRWRRPPSGR